MKSAKTARFVALGFAITLISSGTACIFEEGKYKGGGRLDTAATGKEDDSSSSSSGSSSGDDDDDIVTSSSTSGASTSGLVDAGQDG